MGRREYLSNMSCTRTRDMVLLVLIIELILMDVPRRFWKNILVVDLKRLRSQRVPQLSSLWKSLVHLKKNDIINHDNYNLKIVLILARKPEDKVFSNLT